MRKYFSLNSNVKALFLLYVSVMLIITFLQQELVLLPELQNLDIIGEDARAQMLELFIGSFFYAEMNGKKFKDWWGVAMVAQSVMLAYSVILCAVNIGFGANKAMELTTYTSLLFLGGEKIEPWVRMPLAAINVFEVLYWVVMALLVGGLCGTRFGKSFKFVMSTYGVGYLFYIAFLMFLMLYLT